MGMDKKTTGSLIWSASVGGVVAATMVTAFAPALLAAAFGVTALDLGKNVYQVGVMKSKKQFQKMALASLGCGCAGIAMFPAAVPLPIPDPIAAVLLAVVGLVAVAAVIVPKFLPKNEQVESQQADVVAAVADDDQENQKKEMQDGVGQDMKVMPKPGESVEQIDEEEKKEKEEQEQQDESEEVSPVGPKPVQEGDNIEMQEIKPDTPDKKEPSDDDTEQKTERESEDEGFKALTPSPPGE